MDRQLKKQIYCGNCGKYGHTFKKCKEPITSIGIVAFHIDTRDIDPADSLKVISKCCSLEHDLTRFFSGIEKKKNSRINNSTIKFLLIRRKNSLGYMEFVRGRYQINNYKSIENLFKQMVTSEINFLVKNDFDKVWSSLWLHKNKHNINEYTQSKKKFELLKNNTTKLSLDYLSKNVIPLYTHPEWGFPKGRRNLHEKNLPCALREFSEETNYTRHDIQILDKMNKMVEIFKGTNGIPYKHIYYVGHCLFPQVPKIDSNNHEVGDIGWFTLKDALKLIRNRHAERKVALKNLHEEIIKLFEDNVFENTDQNNQNA